MLVDDYFSVFIVDPSLTGLTHFSEEPVHLPSLQKKAAAVINNLVLRGVPPVPAQNLRRFLRVMQSKEERFVFLVVGATALLNEILHVRLESAALVRPASAIVGTLAPRGLTSHLGHPVLQRAVGWRLREGAQLRALDPRLGDGRARLGAGVDAGTSGTSPSRAEAVASCRGTSSLGLLDRPGVRKLQGHFDEGAVEIQTKPG